MGKILYLECNSGISGDMTVGALLDLGADRKVLEAALQSLSVGNYHLHFGRTKKCGLDAYDFDVHLEEGHSHHGEGKGHGERAGHDHGNVHGERTDHTHGEHTHDHSCGHGEGHSHIHRNLYDIYAVIDRLDSGDRVKQMARRMFEIVAQAEAKAHGLPVEEVHFHEVGAIDSIVDIISVAVCMDNLGIEEVAVSPLTEGSGAIRCQHGVIPVPVPATVNIASAHGLTLKLTDNPGEMVTPTGAAIAAALKTREELPTACRIVKIGMGAGKKDFKQANVLRAMILEEIQEKKDPLLVLEANIDDSTGEMLGYAMECLLEAGAKDAWMTPIYMKKNRPAYLLSVLCEDEDAEKMEDILFSQTTTIGIRRHAVERTTLAREKRKVNTELGEALVKGCSHKGETYCYPEYESVRAISRERGLDFQTVYCKIREEAKKQWNKN